MRTMYLAAALLLLAVAAEPAFARGVTFKEAYETAQAQVPDGQLLITRREQGNYGFYFWSAGQLWEYEVKISTGQIVKVKNPTTVPDSNINVPKVVEALKNRKGAKIPISRFIELALDKSKGGEVGRIELRTDGDRLVVVVEVVNGNSTSQVVIDTADGKIISG